MIRKLLISLLALVMCFTACFALASCSDDPVVGPQGDKGDKGDQGEKGPAGEQGPVGPAGEQGIGVKSVEIVDGKLVFTYTDDTKSAPIEFPTIKGDNGADGEDGADGADGKDGVGIKGVALSAEGKLVITFTNDETTEIAIPVKNGENGADGADGRGIAKIESVAGKLVITYTDNTTEEVALPTVECAHENGREEVVLKNHTLTENGTYLYVCNDCGHSEIAYKTVHDFTVGKVTPATCTTPKKTADVCKICGLEENAVEVGEPLGHAWVTDKVVVEKGKTICENGGQKVDYCTRCFVVTSYATDATGHKVAEWTKVTDPTKTTTGSISGLCETCGKNVTEELPKLNKDAYAYAEEVEVKSCASRKGVATYTIYVNAKGEFVATETEGYKALVYTVTLVPGNHTLNDVEMDDKLVYDPDVTAGITEFTDNKATCTETGAGYYTCEDCGELVKVTTTKAHTYDAKDVVVTEGKEPTCENKGEGTVECTTCKQVVTVEVAALGHKYVYTVKKTTTTVEGATVDTYKLYITCEACDFIDVKDIEGEPVRVEPTCTEEGSITYKYKDVNGELKEQVEVLGETAHKLNGIFMDKETYPWDYAGITEFTDNKATCTKNGAATYNCDVCKDLILVTTTKDHAWDETKLTIVEPTCTEDGYKEGPCATCPVEEGATAKIVRETIPALGHDYKYEVVDGAAEGTYDLVITCGREDCDFKNTIENVTDITDVADATCVSEGIKQVTYKDAEGKEVKVKFNVPKTQHYFMDGDKKVFVDPDKYYSKNYEAITEFVDHASDCKTKENGQGHYVCAYCKDLQLVKTQYEHDMEYTTSAPTCTESGVKTGVCTVCEEKVEEVTPAPGHKYVAVVTVVPTFETNGTVEFCCTECDTKIVMANSLPTLDSSEFYQIKNITPATCSSEGVDEYTLSIEIITGVVVKFNAVVPKTPHVKPDADKYHEYLWIETVKEIVDDETVENTYLYTGYACAKCAKMVVIDSKKVVLDVEIPEGTENVAEVILSEDEELKKLIEEGYASINVKLVGIYVWEEEVVEGEGEEATTKVLKYTVVEFELTTTSEAFYVVLVEEVEVEDEVEDEVVEGETGDATLS